MIVTDRKKVLVLRLDLAQQIGRNEALLLSQIDYWLERTHNFAQGRFWVYNSVAAWAKQLGISVGRVKLAASNLELQGLILRRRLSSHPYDRTFSYTICYERLRQMGYEAGRQGNFGRELAGGKADPWDKPWAAENDWNACGEESICPR
jgi:hypothetical protein